MAAGSRPTLCESELLCFFQNNANKIAKDILTNRVLGFYTLDEIVTAKCVLNGLVENAKVSGLTIDVPRLVERRGEGRKKAELDDMTTLWERLDIAKAALPTFCAVRLGRLPPLVFNDADTSSLAASMMDQFAGVNSLLADLSARLREVGGSVEGVGGAVSKVGGAVEKVNGSVDKVGGVMERMNGTIEKVSGGMNKVSGVVDKVLGVVEKVSGAVEKIGGAVDKVKGEIDRVGVVGDKVAGGVSKISGIVDKIDGSMGKMNGDVDQVGGAVDRVSEGMDKLREAVDKVDSRVGQVVGAVDQVGGDVGKLNGAIDALSKIPRPHPPSGMMTTGPPPRPLGVPGPALATLNHDKDDIQRTTDISLIPTVAPARPWGVQGGQPGSSWADQMERPGPFQTTESDSMSFRKAKPSPMKTVVRGNKVLPSDSVIKAAPRRITVFVGRLDKDATAEALVDYLSAAGVANPICKKLSAKDGRVFNTSAFMVSCEAKYSSVLYDDSIWPSGSELREWVFYNRRGVDQSQNGVS